MRCASLFAVGAVLATSAVASASSSSRGYCKPDHYAAIYATPRCNASELKSSYRLTLQGCHPDRWRCEIPFANKCFIAAKAAGDVLLDKQEKKKYDDNKRPCCPTETSSDWSRICECSGGRHPECKRGSWWKWKSSWWRNMIFLVTGGGLFIFVGSYNTGDPSEFARPFSTEQYTLQVATILFTIIAVAPLVLAAIQQAVLWLTFAYVFFQAIVFPWQRKYMALVINCPVVHLVSFGDSIQRVFILLGTSAMYPAAIFAASGAWATFHGLTPLAWLWGVLLHGLTFGLGSVVNILCAAIGGGLRMFCRCLAKFLNVIAYFLDGWAPRAPNPANIQFDATLP